MHADRKTRIFFLLLAFFGVAVLAVVAPTRRLTGQIVFEHAPDNSAPWPTLDIYSVDADGSRLKALTHDGHSHNPSWSPDGRHILFIHDNFWPEGPKFRNEYPSHFSIELDEMDSDGGNAHLLRRFNGILSGAAWSPDGKSIAVAYSPREKKSLASGSGMSRFGIYRIPADGKGRPELLFPNAMTPAWSPDGKKLAFSMEISAANWVIGVGNPDGSHLIRLTLPSHSQTFQPQMRYAGSPVWSPDGKQIAFDAYEVVLSGVGVNEEPQIFLMSADGSRLRQLTTDPQMGCNQPSWSPDGTEIAFSCRAPWASCAGGIVGGMAQSRFGCVRRIFVMPLNGLDLPARPTKITQIDGAFPAFDPAP